MGDEVIHDRALLALGEGVGPELRQVQRDGPAGAAPVDVPLPLGLAVRVPHRGQHQLAARGAGASPASMLTCGNESAKPP